MTTMAAPRESETGTLKYLVYASTAATDLGSRDLEEILQTAREHNASVGLTGLLLFRDGGFVQFLEGPPEELDALMARIVADRRHHGVRVITAETVTERSFPDWRMAYRRVDGDGRSGGVGRSIDRLASESVDGDSRDSERQITEWFRDGEKSESADS